jgi:hypothetical protein
MWVSASSVAGDRQECDAILRNLDPYVLPCQKLEYLAMLSVYSRRAIIGPATQLTAPAVKTRIDLMAVRRLCAGHHFHRAYEIA